MRPHVLNSYFVDCTGDNEGVSVVAFTAKQAKKVAYHHEGFDVDWIDVKIQKQSDVDITGMAEGYIIPLVEGMKRGAYNPDCSICGDIDCDGCPGKDEDDD